MLVHRRSTLTSPNHLESRVTGAPRPLLRLLLPAVYLSIYYRDPRLLFPSPRMATAVIGEVLRLRPYEADRPYFCSPQA
jgi:hypothetical protein